MAKAETEMVAAVFRTIFAQPDLASMSKQWDKVRDELAGRYPKIRCPDGRRQERGAGLRGLEQ